VKRTTALALSLLMLAVCSTAVTGCASARASSSPDAQWNGAPAVNDDATVEALRLSDQDRDSAFS